MTGATESRDSSPAFTLPSRYHPQPELRDLPEPVGLRKVSGATRPSQVNAEAFDLAVREVAVATQRLLDSLVTTAPPKDREVEAAKARARAQLRYT